MELISNMYAYLWEQRAETTSLLKHTEKYCVILYISSENLHIHAQMSH
jgi:nitrate/nitrite-specific signal transduction histidine kinase